MSLSKQKTLLGQIITFVKKRTLKGGKIAIKRL